MTKEKTERKATDYSASAVELVNPQEVNATLKDLLELKKGRALIASKLNENELYQKLLLLDSVIADNINHAKDLIKKYGSYQNTEEGMYGIQYKRRSKVYDAAKFKSHFTKFAPAVIEETVNAKALEGLIKGKLLTEDELEGVNVLSFKETFAFYIDVGE